MTDTTDSVDSQAAGWLARVDAGDGAGSLQAAGAAFRDAVTAEQWSEQLASARGPLGALSSRVLAVEQRLDGVPGAAPGEYIVRQYHSVYGGIRAVVETLTLYAEHDAVWRVVGYFIR